MRFWDAFHGIGGFRKGLEDAGMTCVGGAEIDKYACKAYGVINNERCEPTDIRNVDPGRMPDIDCFVFGWPCQDNSVAGKRAGQKSGTRSGLLFEAARIIRAKKPKYFIAENVEGLFSVNNGKDFYPTIQLFTDLGYDCQWQVLNTRWFIPQNRERIFIVGHVRGIARPEVFPITEDAFMDSTTLREKGKKIQVIPCLETTGYKGISSERFYGVLHDSKVRAVLTPGREEKRQNGRRFKNYNEPMFTLTAQDIHGVEVDGDIRKLTPLEYFRFQGYPDWWMERCKEAGISDSQLYRMAGNGVSSPVAEEVGKRLMA